MNNGKICISVSASTADRMIEQIRIAESSADLVEVRLDHLEADECTAETIQRIFAVKSAVPWIVTFRSPEQGGGRKLTFEQRMDFWKQPLNAEYIDVEEDLIESVDLASHMAISSIHDLNGVPRDIEKIYDHLGRSRADIIKIAYAATDITDTIPVWSLLERARNDSRAIIPIAMGDAGKLTRILGLAHGSFLTYASLNVGAETAAGQVTAQDLINVYSARDRDRDTRVFGVIGDPISQSISPYMHNPAFASAGVNAVFVPLLVKNIAAFMRRMVEPETREVELNFGGFSVTMPHKQSIMPHLDVITPMAASIGAVNTVQIENGKLTGHNTDAGGFIAPLLEKFGSLLQARVAVFGAGGAARAVVYALKQEGADVTVFARDAAKASHLAVAFDVSHACISDVKKANARKIGADFDILVDTTPFGMKGPLENETLFEAAELEGLKLVYDLVTKASDTPIIREARVAGIPTLGGVEMLVAQGTRQFEIWTGTAAPVDAMRSAVDVRMQALRD
jgi:3-dehydroquinate dehydratase / shikimate dehydrogenase